MGRIPEHYNNNNNLSLDDPLRRGQPFPSQKVSLGQEVC